MIAWLKYWFMKPEPQPQQIPTIEVHPRNLYPHTRYTMSLPRILEWWASSPQLDPFQKPHHRQSTKEHKARSPCRTALMYNYCPGGAGGAIEA